MKKYYYLCDIDATNSNEEFDAYGLIETGLPEQQVVELVLELNHINLDQVDEIIEDRKSSPVNEEDLYHYGRFAFEIDRFMNEVSIFVEK